MKFDFETLYNIAIREYREADFLLDGAKGFSQREGITEWAYYSSKEEYASEEEVVDELKKYIKEEKEYEY